MPIPESERVDASKIRKPTKKKKKSSRKILFISGISGELILSRKISTSHFERKATATNSALPLRVKAHSPCGPFNGGMFEDFSGFNKN